MSIALVKKKNFIKGTINMKHKKADIFQAKDRIKFVLNYLIIRSEQVP